MHILFVDCRSAQHYAGGTIFNAINFDYQQRENPRYVNEFFAQPAMQMVFDEKRVIHVVVFGSGSSSRNGQQTPSISELTMIVPRG